MDIFYNPNGIGDVLIIPFADGDRYEIKYERTGDVIRIVNKDKDVLGYNIFQASRHVDVNGTGKITMTEALLDQLKNLFLKEGIADSLETDLSPSFVVGYVQEKNAHENADKLSVCQVDVGTDILQIVCGAPNVAQGQKVVVAKPGASLPSGMKIKAAKLRGVPSNGMMCSQKELGMLNAPEEKGIYVLDDTHTVGSPFEW